MGSGASVVIVRIAGVFELTIVEFREKCAPAAPIQRH